MSQPISTTIKSNIQGLPWCSSGEDSILPMQDAWVLSLVRELRSHMPHGTAKKEKIKFKKRKERTELERLEQCQKKWQYRSGIIPEPIKCCVGDSDLTNRHSVT